VALDPELTLLMRSDARCRRFDTTGDLSRLAMSVRLDSASHRGALLLCQHVAVKFREIANRLTGISTPIFGVSWTPAALDRDVARQVITTVETRRVLFSTYTNEVPSECIQSVLEIRQFLTQMISNPGIGPELTSALRLIRGSCVRFLERTGATESRDSAASGRRLHREPHWRMNDYWFGEALGELRAGVALQVAIIATSYGLDVEDELAHQLPAPDGQ
jgi:hypothetical protein